MQQVLTKDEKRVKHPMLRESWHSGGSGKRTLTRILKTKE